MNKVYDKKGKKKKLTSIIYTEKKLKYRRSSNDLNKQLNK